jgi:hypothetical protein
MKWITLMTLLLFMILLSGCQKGSSASITGQQALEVMRSRLGLVDAEEDFYVYALANCQGPDSRFETLVISGPAGMRFEQKSESSHVLGVHQAGAAWWHNFNTDTTTAVSDAVLTFLMGHDLHMIACFPENRFGEMLSEKDTTYYNDKALMLSFRDVKDGLVRVYYHAESLLPLGFTIQNHLNDHAEYIDVLFSDWEQIEGVKTFTRASFIQGEDVYDYAFTHVSFESFTGEVFTQKQKLIAVGEEEP